MKRGTKRVLEYARLAMGFANVRASRYGIRACSGGYSNTNAGAGAGLVAPVTRNWGFAPLTVDGDQTEGLFCWDGSCRGSSIWGVDTVFRRPPEKNELVLFYYNGVYRYCAFSTKTKHPRSDSASLEPSEPILCIPPILPE